LGEGESRPVDFLGEQHDHVDGKATAVLVEEGEGEDRVMAQKPLTSLEGVAFWSVVGVILVAGAVRFCCYQTAEEKVSVCVLSGLQV
jgi:hypothetical protein